MNRDHGCVVLDIDDTLYLERDYVRSGFAVVGAWVERNLGLPSFSDRCWAAFCSGSRGAVFDEVLASYGYDDEQDAVVPKLVERYRRHTPSIALLPDAEEALARLSKRCRLAALSDGPPASQRAKVRALGLHGRLDPIVLTAELGRGRGKPKPDPTGFRVIQERVGVDGTRCAYVADNPLKDFRAPAALGWSTVRVRRPEGLHRDVPSGPDVGVEIPSLATLEEVLPGFVRAPVRS